MNKINELMNMACLIAMINLTKKILTMKLSIIIQMSQLLMNTLIFKIKTRQMKYDNLLIRSNNINRYEEQ